MSPVEFHNLLPSEAIAKPFDELFPSTGSDVKNKSEDPDQMEVDEDDPPEGELGQQRMKFQHLKTLISTKQESDAIKEAFPEVSGPPEETKTFLRVRKLAEYTSFSLCN